MLLGVRFVVEVKIVDWKEIREPGSYWLLVTGFLLLVRGLISTGILLLS